VERGYKMAASVAKTAKKGKITLQNDNFFIYYFGVLFFFYKFASFYNIFLVVVPSADVTSMAVGVGRA